MSTIFECDWCGKRFSDRAAVASVDVTVQSVAENVHMCHGCLPDWISDQLDPLDGEEVLVTDGGTGRVCNACGESFETLTRLRIHEKDDCQARETYAEIDPESHDPGADAADELVVCRQCGASNPDADFEYNTAFDGDDFHYICEFVCRACGFENENRVVLTSVDRGDLGKLPPHLQPDDENIRTDGGTDLVTACPECTHHNVRQRDDGTWRCGECEAEFSRPVRRARRHGGGNYSAAGEALRHADPDDLRADGGVVEENADPRTPDGTLRLTDEGLEMPAMLKGYVGTFWIRTADITGEYETTDTGLPNTEFYDGVFAVYPEDDGDYNPHLKSGWLSAETEDHGERVFEVVDERTEEDVELATDGGVQLGAGEQTLYAAKCIECGQVDTYVAEEAVSEGDERDNYCTRCPGFETVRVTKVWERDGDE